MLLRSVRNSHECNLLRICGNEIQPGLQQVEKLAMPLLGIEISVLSFFLTGVMKH